MAEDEFDPIPVLITKNPQGKKERTGKTDKLDISSHKISNVPNLQGFGISIFNEEIRDTDSSLSTGK